MKRKLLKYSALIVCAAIIFGACKKKHEATPADDTSSESTTYQDQANYSSASNQSAEEADGVVSGYPSTTRITSTTKTVIPITGATVDSLGQWTYLLTYNGVSASGKARTGTDTLFVSGPWHVIGAKIISKYSYTITNSNGKTMTLVGVDTITNISGGNSATLIGGSSTSVTTSHTGKATVTFDDGSKRTWSHSRQKVKTYSTPGSFGGVITATITGTGTPLTYTGIEAWGTNRNGEPFYGQIPTASPLIYGYTVGVNTNCTHFWPYSGVYIHQGVVSGLKVTFGVDQTGAVITPAIPCPYGIKLDWTFLSASKEAIVAY